jgi:hypothetical protein
MEIKGKTFQDTPNISFYQVDSSVITQHVDWLDRPRVIISDAMKLLLEKYNPRLRFKAIHCIDQAASLQTTYWIAEIPAVECISPHSQFHNNGTIKKLLLDDKKIKKEHIFMIANVVESYIVISLELAESILRRSMTGFMLTKVTLDREANS